MIGARCDIHLYDTEKVFPVQKNLFGALTVTQGCPAPDLEVRCPACFECFPASVKLSLMLESTSSW